MTALTTEAGPFTCGGCGKEITRETPENGWRDADGEPYCYYGDPHAPAAAEAGELPDSECSEFDPSAPEPVTGPLCEKDGEIIDTHGGEHYWQCGHPGTVIVPSGRRLCEDHAGELGYGPKQEEYGFDPADEPDFAATAAGTENGQ